MIGDFNCEPDDIIISDFMNNYGIKNLVKSPTCFKSDSPRCIDLIVMNRTRTFQNTVKVHAGLSDFHAMIVTALKGGYKKKDLRSLDIEITPNSVARNLERTFVIRFHLNCRIMRTTVLLTLWLLIHLIDMLLLRQNICVQTTAPL